MTQSSSQQNVVFVIVTQIHMLAHFSASNIINFFHGNGIIALCCCMFTSLLGHEDLAIRGNPGGSDTVNKGNYREFIEELAKYDNVISFGL